MNIFLDNVNLHSTSGPNHFASKLKKYMERQGNTFTFAKDFDAQLSFISAVSNLAPIYQRMDWIYFNSEQDFKQLNKPIQETYKLAKGVIFQSEFNKELTFKYFGSHENYKVIHNGADLDFINSVPTLSNNVIDNYEKVWCCASSWRPHKRLNENIRYFLEHSSDKECLVVAGHLPNPVLYDRVYYVGDLDIKTLISLYKRSDYFIHLAYLDHCPNVVVDAVASGCKIICSSTGGTKEIAIGATIIQESEWDLSPIKLYNPPEMDFSNKTNNDCNVNIDMSYVASRYDNFIGGKNENN